MSRRSALGALGVAPVAAVAAPGMANVNASASGAAPDRYRDLRPGGAFDRYLAQLAKHDKFSGTVLVAHRGETVFSRAYGMADKKKSVPNRENTVFALASASKPFTGVAVLQLAQQGKVEFNKTVGTYLDDFPAEIADHVTVHHVFTHTSGLGDNGPYFRDHAGEWNSEAEMLDGTLKSIKQTRPQFTPGTKNSYSNAGLNILGAIVQRVSGRSYYDYVREHVFRPAGMTSTDFYHKPQWLTGERMAHPYTRDSSGRWADELAEKFFVGLPAGDAHSTGPDLVRFGRAVAMGKLLNPAFTELITSGKYPPVPKADTREKDPALQATFESYGASTRIFNNQWIFGHGGGSVGESTFWNVYRDLDWAATILSNYGVISGDNDTVDVQPIMSRLDHIITDPRS